MNDQTIARLRIHAQAILDELPPEPIADDLGSVIAQIKALVPHVPAPPWYLSEVDESDDGYDFQTLATHEPPHYEETVATFYPGNHGTAPSELILLLLNNFEALIEAAEKGIAKS